MEILQYFSVEPNSQNLTKLRLLTLTTRTVPFLRNEMQTLPSTQNMWHQHGQIHSAKIAVSSRSCARLENKLSPHNAIVMKETV